MKLILVLKVFCHKIIRTKRRSAELPGLETAFPCF